jgi:hypothetical protein
MTVNAKGHAVINVESLVWIVGKRQDVMRMKCPATFSAALASEVIPLKDGLSPRNGLGRKPNLLIDRRNATAPGGVIGPEIPRSVFRVLPSLPSCPAQGLGVFGRYFPSPVGTIYSRPVF